MVSRARSRASSSSSSSSASTRAAGKVVYYDPAGGRVIAVLAQEDEEYERELTRTGNQWRKTAEVPADQMPPEGASLSQFFVQVGRDGKVAGMEQRTP